MHVAFDIVPDSSKRPLQALSDDGGTKVADVEVLCDVRAAVVHDDRLWFAGRMQPETVG